MLPEAADFVRNSGSVLAVNMCENDSWRVDQSDHAFLFATQEYSVVHPMHLLLHDENGCVLPHSGRLLSNASNGLFCMSDSRNAGPTLCHSEECIRLLLCRAYLAQPGSWTALEAPSQIVKGGGFTADIVRARAHVCARSHIAPSVEISTECNSVWLDIDNNLRVSEWDHVPH